MEKKEERYLKYREDFKKVNLYSLIREILAMILILLIIFLPIYSYSYEMNFMEQDFPTMEAYLEFIKNLTPEQILNGTATVNGNCSVFDELLSLIQAFGKQNSASEVESMINYIVGMLIMFPAATILFGVISLCMSGKNTYESVMNFQKNDDYTLLEYTKLKKTGTTEGKVKIFRQQNIYSLVNLRRAVPRKP